MDRPVSYLSDEDFYRAFVQLTPDGIWRLEVNPPIPVDLPEAEQIEAVFRRARFVECNQTFAIACGLPNPQAISGLAIADIFSPEEPQNKLLIQHIVRAGYHLTGGEYSPPGSRGSQKWTLVSFLGVIQDDALQGGWGTTQDITEAKRNAHIQSALYRISQAANTTQNLQEMFKTIHETLDELMPAENLFIALYDPNTDLLTFPYFADTYDSPPSPHHPGRGLTEYVLRTGLPTLADPLDFDHLVEIGEAESQGTPSIDWLGVPLILQNKVIGVIAAQTYTEGVRFSEVERELLTFVSNQIAMAIDRKRAEETLRMNEARFRAIVEDQTELICRFLPDTSLTFVNEAFCRYYGRHRESLLGKSFTNLLSDEFRDAIIKSFGELTFDNPSITAEYPGIKAGNFTTWEQWSTRAIFDENRQVVEYQCVGRNLTDRKKIEDELRFLSTHDSLTGLYNRGFFEAEMGRFQRGRVMPVSVIMADVDGLKEINDLLGHSTGDELLCQAALILRNAFRTEDVVARIGGDEFGILIPGADGETADHSVERILRSMDAHNATPGKILVRMSLGCATALQGEDIPAAYRDADSRLLLEKARKRSRRAAYDPSPRHTPGI